MNRDWNWHDVLRWSSVEARRSLGPGPLAEDAAQEAAIRAWRRRADCLTPEAPRTWVAAITRNEVARVVARAKAHELTLVEELERALDPGEPDGSPEDRADVRRAVNRLPAEDRRLLGMRYWLDLTQTEVAQRLGIPEGTAKVRLHRARDALRTELVGA